MEGVAVEIGDRPVPEALVLLGKLSMLWRLGFIEGRTAETGKLFCKTSHICHLWSCMIGKWFVKHPLYIYLL